jgi:hypothetical protein
VASRGTATESARRRPRMRRELHLSVRRTALSLEFVPAGLALPHIRPLVVPMRELRLRHPARPTVTVATRLGHYAKLRRGRSCQKRTAQANQNDITCDIVTSVLRRASASGGRVILKRPPGSARCCRPGTQDWPRSTVSCANHQNKIGCDTQRKRPPIWRGKVGWQVSASEDGAGGGS